MTQDEEADGLHTEPRPLRIEKSGSRYTLGKQAHKRIGIRLREVYDSVVQQPIPSRLTDLIARLDDPPNSTDSVES